VKKNKKGTGTQGGLGKTGEGRKKNGGFRVANKKVFQARTKNTLGDVKGKRVKVVTHYKKPTKTIRGPDPI